MRNETISKMFGAALGAAIIIAGLAAFGPKVTGHAFDSAAQTLAPAVSLRASTTINVQGGN